MVALADEAGPEGAEPLLVEAMKDGRRMHDEALEAARSRAADQVAGLPGECRGHSPSPYPVRFGERLVSLRREAGAAAAARHGVATP